MAVYAQDATSKEFILGVIIVQFQYGFLVTAGRHADANLPTANLQSDVGKRATGEFSRKLSAAKPHVKSALTLATLGRDPEDITLKPAGELQHDETSIAYAKAGTVVAFDVC